MYGQPAYGAPMYPPPPPPPMYYPPQQPQQQGPMIISLNNNNNNNNNNGNNGGNGGGTNCPVCGHETGNIGRKKVGSVTFAWCVVLAFVTGVCWFIPFCNDSCKDTELVCIKCQSVKATIPASCC